MKLFIGHIKYIEQAIQWTEKKRQNNVCTYKETYGSGVVSTLFGDFTYENAAEFVISTMAYIMNFILRS